MVTCTNCNKQKKRINFCNSKCKMQFHRKNKTSIATVVVKPIEKTIDKSAQRLHKNMNIDSYI